MAYRTGRLPDHPEVVKRRIGLHLHPAFGAMRAGALPLSTSNRLYLPTSKGGPGILDQHDTGSCEGHAHASGITLFFALLAAMGLGTALPEVVSPVGAYLGALMCDAQPNADGSLPDLFDTGTMPSSILAALGLWGMTGASVWGQYPASSQTMYLAPSNPNSPLIRPTPEKLYAESSFRLKGAYFVQSTGLQKVLDIMRALAAKMPVTIAIPASGSQFQGYAGGVLTATQLTGDIDHANLLVDYAWTGTQAQFDSWQAGAPGLDQYLVFYDVNSWGLGWGESDVPTIAGGLARFNRSVIDQLEDAAVLDLQKVA